jgi:hypothetical protein
MSRSREPEGTKQLERTPAEEKAWSRAADIKAARTWLGGVDQLARQNKLTHAASSVIDACETVVKLGERESFWLVKRALESLAANGYAPDQKFHGSWLQKLREFEEPAEPASSVASSDFEWRL